MQTEYAVSWAEGTARPRAGVIVMLSAGLRFSASGDPITADELPFDDVAAVRVGAGCTSLVVARRAGRPIRIAGRACAPLVDELAAGLAAARLSGRGRTGSR